MGKFESDREKQKEERREIEKKKKL